MLQTLYHNMEAQLEPLLALAPESGFLASPKGALSPRCGQVGACCSFDFLGSVQKQSHHPNPGTVESGARCLCWLLSSFMKKNP